MADGSIKIDTKIDSSSLPRQLKAMETACKSSSGIMGAAFAKMRDVMQGPVLAAKMVKDGLVAIGKAVIGPAAEIEDFVAAFTPLTGSVKDAKIMIAALNKEAATTPYELTTIASVGKQLLPVLGNDVKKVTETFRMLGDTAGGNAEKLDSIARGYVKVMNTGKVSMEALNMISDAGVPIQGQLAKSMGITVEEMYKLSSQGNISASELTKAFQTMTTEGGIFYNGMAVASETLSGKTSTMNDSLKMAAAALGDRMLPAVKDITTAVSDAANGFTDFISDHTDLAKETNTLITASEKYETAVRNLDNAQKDISDTERTLLTGRKELARLELQKALSETSKGYAKTKKEISDLKDVEAGHLRNLEKQSVLMKQLNIVANGPPAAASAAAKALGISIEAAQTSYGKAAKNFENENSKLLKVQTKLQETTVEYSESIAALGRAVNDGTLKIDIYKLTNRALYDEVMAAAESQKVLARETTNTGAATKTSTASTQENTDETEDNTEAQNKNAAAIQKQQQSARNWANAIGKIAGSLKNELGETFSGIVQDVANVADSIVNVISTGGKDVLAWAGLVASAMPLIETMFEGTGFEAAYAANQAKIMSDAVKESGMTLAAIIQSGSSSYEGYLGTKQANDYFDTVAKKYKEAAFLMKSADDLLASRTAGDYISGFVKVKEQMAAQMQQMSADTLKAANDLQYVYDTVYSGNNVTASTSAVLEKWADELEDVVTAYGKTSIEVAAVNESYQKLLNDALYPTAAALRDANATIKTNSSLWTDAAKATYAYEASLSSLRDKAASFYESFANIGSDIADTLVSSLTDGLDETSFLDAMKEYITKMVIQAAVYTEALTDKIAKIGKKIASAIAGGLTGNSLSGIKQELSDLYAEASGKASAAMDIVNSAFAGNAGVASIAGGLGASLTPSLATTGGSNITVTVNAVNTTVLDGRAIATSVAENIDSVVAAI